MRSGCAPDALRALRAPGLEATFFFLSGRPFFFIPAERKERWTPGRADPASKGRPFFFIRRGRRKKERSTPRGPARPSGEGNGAPYIANPLCDRVAGAGGREEKRKVDPRLAGLAKEKRKVDPWASRPSLAGSTFLFFTKNHSPMIFRGEPRALPHTTDQRTKNMDMLHT